MKTISTMRKEELQEELDSRSIIYSSRDTVEELRAAVTHARKSLPGSEKKDDPQRLTTLKREDLMKKCQDLGIQITPHTLRGEMIYRIKKHIALTSEVKGSDTYNIGQHQGLMYRTIRTQHSDYCEWVKETVKESQGSCHWELERFARYLNRSLSPAPTGREAEPKTSRVKKEQNPTTKQELDELRGLVRNLDERVRSSNKRESQATSSSSMAIDSSGIPPESLETILKTIMQRLESLEMKETKTEQSEESWSLTKSHDGDS
jgi:hypothetical protein